MPASSSTTMSYASLAKYTPPTNFTNSIHPTPSCATPPAYASQTAYVEQSVVRTLRDEICGQDDGNSTNWFSCQKDNGSFLYWILGQPGTIPSCSRGPSPEKVRDKVADGCKEYANGAIITINKTKGAFFMYNMETCQTAIQQLESGCQDSLGGGWLLVDDSQGGQANFSIFPDYQPCGIDGQGKPTKGSHL